jgi:hypothetical protein
MPGVSLKQLLRILLPSLSIGCSRAPRLLPFWAAEESHLAFPKLGLMELLRHIILE